MGAEMNEKTLAAPEKNIRLRDFKNSTFNSFVNYHSFYWTIFSISNFIVIALVKENQ